MINKNIKVDLHIHSKASEYKEDGDIVKESTINNLDTLFEKLNEHGINMFSITDHNRFDVELYREINKRLSSGPIGSVQAALPGVEFDVEFESNLPHCHVIAIFDTHPWNNEDNSIWENDYNTIAQAINKDELKGKNDKYSLTRFESILKNIGKNVLLIAHQHQSISSSNIKKRSLSCASTDAIEYVKFGYIDALEYTKARIQGILLSDLTELDATAATIVGSDCHTWSVYPLHDKAAKPRDSFYSTIRALPTFKGLAMALSSPSTRFQQQERRNKNSFLEWIDINGEKVELCPGLNAIIGENGIGKSSLLSIITQEQDKLDSHVKALKNKNHITAEKTLKNADAVVTIKQNQLQERFWKQKDGSGLFDNSLYPQPDNSIFEQTVKRWSNALIKLINSNIEAKTAENVLKSTSFLLRPELEAETYHVHAEIPNEESKQENPHDERLQSIEKILSLIEAEASFPYYKDDKELAEKLERAIKALAEVKRTLSSRKQGRDSEILARNAIAGAIREYEADISAKVSDKDRERMNYRTEKMSVLDALKGVIANANKTPEQIPDITLPENEGIKSNPSRGFVFISATKYSDKPDIQNAFLEYALNGDLNTLDKIKEIDSTDAIEKAVRSHKKGDWLTRWNLYLDEFIKEMCKEQRYIQGSGSRRIAGTLGEQSLTYYKYCSYAEDKVEVFVIDQPEDHISNSRISSDLNEFFNRMRNNRQVIFVTHSPLLVVNQDVDNVICLDSNGHDELIATHGCLESDGVLDVIANKMEGGTDAVKRRLKAYGQAI